MNSQLFDRQALLRGFAGAAAATALWGSPARSQELKPLRVGLAEGDDATPTLYAQKTGIFKKYGLDVQVIEQNSGAAALAALAGGALDVTGTSLLSFFSAVSRGLPLKLVAPLAVYGPESLYAVVLVKKSAPYTSGRDLNGKTIASPALKDLNWLATMAWIDKNGGDSTTVRSVELPSSATMAALEDGRIDASTVTTPRYVQAVNAGVARILGKAYEAIAPRFTFAGIVANGEWALANADTVTRFGRALREASAYTNTHHAETMQVYADFAKIDPKAIVGAPRAITEPYITAAGLKPLMDVAVKYKVLPAPLDLASLISPAALKPGA